MFVKQADLFWGLSHDFVKKVMEKYEKENVAAGEFLFSEGDPAVYFYTLIKGHVKLRLGKTGVSVFTINHAGESFGWSSLVARDTYSAAAECIEPTTVIKIDRKVLMQILGEYPDDGFVFMKRLAALLGNRLLMSYEMISSLMKLGSQPSFGTGQVLETAAEE